MEAGETANEFIEKYTSTHSMRVKSQLRDLWANAARDFNSAGMVLRARRMAFKEDMSEGRWMSAEQLEDEFKSTTHVQNYMKFASENQLVKMTRSGTVGCSTTRRSYNGGATGKRV